MSLPPSTKSSQEKRILTLGAFMIAAIAGITIFVILPSLNDIKKIRSEILDQYLLLEKKYLSTIKSRGTKESLIKIEPEIAKLDSLLIPRSEQLSFITMLESAAASSSLSSQIKLESSKTDKNFGQKIMLNITTGGTYHQQIKFLHYLEELDYQINILKLEISSAGSNLSADAPENDINATTMALSIETFWR